MSGCSGRWWWRETGERGGRQGWRDQCGFGEAKKTENPSHLGLCVQNVHFLNSGLVTLLYLWFSRCTLGCDSLEPSIPVRQFQAGPNSSAFLGAKSFILAVSRTLGWGQVPAVPMSGLQKVPPADGTHSSLRGERQVAGGLNFMEERGNHSSKTCFFFFSGAFTVKLLCAIYCPALKITMGQNQPGRENKVCSTLPEPNRRPLFPGWWSLSRTVTLGPQVEERWLNIPAVGLQMTLCGCTIYRRLSWPLWTWGQQK